MKIKSNYKDYYDYISNVYGDKDDKIVYVRTRLVPLENIGGTTLFQPCITINKIIVQRDHYFNYLREYYGKHTFKWLSVCGKLYLLVAPLGSNNFQILSKELHADIWTKLFNKSWHKSVVSRDYIGKSSIHAVELSKELNTPVFSFTQLKDSIKVDGNIPILADIGMIDLIESTQLYQEISYFVGNVLNTLDKISESTNKEKLDQHGFDQVISFRHRK